MSKKRMLIVVLAILSITASAAIWRGAFIDEADPAVAHRSINISKQDLDDARQKWTSKGISHYVEEYECHGWTVMEDILNEPGNSPCGEWQLEVISGAADKVISKTWLIKAPDVISTASESTLQHATVSGLFATVDGLLDRTSNGTHYDSTPAGLQIYYVVRFDERLGYPNSITAYAPPSKLPGFGNENQKALVFEMRKLQPYGK